MQQYGDYVIEKQLTVRNQAFFEAQVTITNGGLLIKNGVNEFIVDASANLTTNNGAVTAKRFVSTDGLAIISATPNRMVRFSVTSGLGMALIHKSDPGEGTLSFSKVNAAGAETGSYGNINKDGLLWWEGTINAAKSIGRSDKSLKQNVKDIVGQEALGLISKSRPVWFEWKGQRAKDFGFIAQELEKVIPTAVYGQDGQKGINYQGLASFAFSAIKELDKERAAHVKRMDEMQIVIDQLMEMVKQLMPQSLMSEAASTVSKRKAKE